MKRQAINFDTIVNKSSLVPKLIRLNQWSNVNKTIKHRKLYVGFVNNKIFCNFVIPNTK